MENLFETLGNIFNPSNPFNLDYSNRIDCVLIDNLKTKMNHKAVVQIKDTGEKVLANTRGMLYRTGEAGEIVQVRIEFIEPLP